MLLGMTISLPQKEREFLATNGVGEVKLAKYGAQFMQVIREYCRTKNL